jgi:hypothetical protein
MRNCLLFAASDYFGYMFVYTHRVCLSALLNGVALMGEEEHLPTLEETVQYTTWKM